MWHLCRGRQRNRQRFTTHMAQLLFYPLNLLFGGILVAVAIVVCLSSVMSTVNLTVVKLSLTCVLLWTNTLESFLCLCLLTLPITTGLQGTHIHTALANIPCRTHAPIGVKLLLARAVARTGV